MSNSQKLIDLETRITYLEQTIEDLSKVVFEQSKRIDVQHQLSHKLTNRLSSIENAEPLPDPLDEKPPHY